MICVKGNQKTLHEDIKDYFEDKILLKSAFKTHDYDKDHGRIEERRLNDVVRKHWEVENSLHWVRDVTYNENKSCISDDAAVENMSIIRKWENFSLYFL